MRLARWGTALVCGWTWSTMAVGEPPNIIFVLLDDVGIGELGVSDLRTRPSSAQYDISMPNLKSVAEKSVLFTHAYSAPVCSPARYSILAAQGTGTAPIRGNSGIGRDFRLPSNLETYAAKLQSEGYLTMMTGKWGFETSPRDAGFEKFFGLKTHRESHSCFPAYVFDNFKSPKSSLLNRKRLKFNERKLKRAKLRRETICDVTSMDDTSKCTFFHDMVTAKSLEWIENAVEKDKKFFLQISYTAGHTCSLSSWMRNPFPLGFYAPFTDFESCPIRQEDSQLEMHQCRYVSLLENYLDRDIGRIVQLTKDLGIEENTLLVISSDNAPSEENGLRSSAAFDSLAGRQGGKRTVYEGGVRVPLIIKWPRLIKTKKVVRERVMLFDLHATFLQAAQESFSTESLVVDDSISLIPFIANRDAAQVKRDFIYVEFCDSQAKNWGKIKSYPKRFCSFMLIQDNLKLVFDHDEQSFAVFNLLQDPLETNDLSQSLGDEEFTKLKRSRFELGAYIPLTDTEYVGKNRLRNTKK